MTTRADRDVRQQERLLDAAPRPDLHALEQDRAAHPGARDDGAAADERLGGDAEDDRRRPRSARAATLRLGGQDRPARVVQVEGGRRREQFHVRGVVGVERADVAPVAASLELGPGVGVDLARAGEERQDVVAEVVRRVPIRGIPLEALDQEIGVEEVDAHRGQRTVRVSGHRPRLGRLLVEAHDALVGVDVDDAEARRVGERNVDAADARSRLARHVQAEHPGVVGAVDVVPGEHEHAFGRVAVDRREVLVQRVGRAPVPALVHPSAAAAGARRTRRARPAGSSSRAAGASAASATCIARARRCGECRSSRSWTARSR